MLNQIKMNIAELEQALLSANPEMPILLQKIHTKLRADPDIVTLLDETEIGVIVNGLKSVTNTELTTPKAAKAKAAAKPLSAAKRLEKILGGAISSDDF